ncbi:MAG TPA: TPM domain-containing protein, partial [Geothrix sp.]
MRRLLVLIGLLAGLWGGLGLGAQAAPPPPPERWVTDGSNLLSPTMRDGLDRRLQAYQAGTGHQVLVWIGGTTGADPLEDWTVRAFAAWKVGRKG